MRNLLQLSVMLVAILISNCAFSQTYCPKAKLFTYQGFVAYSTVQCIGTTGNCTSIPSSLLQIYRAGEEPTEFGCAADCSCADTSTHSPIGTTGGGGGYLFPRGNIGNFALQTDVSFIQHKYVGVRIDPMRIDYYIAFNVKYPTAYVDEVPVDFAETCMAIRVEQIDGGGTFVMGTLDASGDILSSGTGNSLRRYRIVD